ncbi:MAG: glycoside hydrolase family 3 C-terminal domain-containing protein [Bryobacterales bacterium]|nr:glycoside hydrolase family 3 C-terminal domain-containing protein [Bryobacterales bacterium]
MTLPRVLLFGAIAGAFLSMQAAAPQKQKSLSSFDPQVKALLAKMTLEEKVGQMTQPDQASLKDVADIENLALGSVLSGGGSDPKAGNSLEAWTNLYDGYQKRALRSRLAIPLLYGVDALHGHNNVIGAVVFPHNIGLGCTRNPALVEKIARITAIEVRATGIQWTFAPCVTVPQDIRWGRTYEGFSEDPKLVKTLGEAATRGLQTADLSDPLSVLACAKHYVGDGGTTFGTGMGGKSPLDQGDMRVDEATMRRLHLQGYVTTLAAGVATVMPSYSSWNGVKVSGSKQLMTDILKTEMGFEGFLISDYNAIDQLDKDYKKAIGISINAGMDMVMVTDKYREYIKGLKELVQEGVVPMSRIDDAVTRILRVKFAMGLMDKSRSQLADRSLWKSFGSAEHRAVARQAVRESLVLLKNGKKTLPLKKSAPRIHVAGKNADDIGNQNGGWTIDWQGISGNAMTTGGTTILAALKGAAQGQVTYSKDGTGAAGASIGVVVIGEKPYAEMQGDRKSLALDAADVAAINNVKKAGIPVVVVLVSGRPMILGDVLDQADAIVAAWLPGTEGAGVSDVLFGDYKPTGKLGFSWPKSDAQLPLGTGNKADVQYKIGYGLKY